MRGAGKGGSGWAQRLAARLLPEGVAPTSGEGRARVGERVAAANGALSLALAAAKAALGWAAGSVSLIADAVNNLADVGSSLVVVFGFRWARKPRDREHPFGHGRVETLTTMVLAMILLGVALEVARAGLRRLFAPEPVEAPAWLLAAVGVTIALKLGMAFAAFGAARLTRSKLLETEAWNHGFDLASTGLVLVALLGARIGWLRLDGAAALGVAGLIAWTGVRYIRESANALIGLAPRPDHLSRLRRVASRVPGVRGVHDVMVHTYGDLRMISLHVEVDADLTVLEAHALAERVEAAVAAAEDGARVVAHVDPVDRSHPLYDEADAIVGTIVRAHPELVGYHDLRLDGPPDACGLAVDLVGHAELPREGFDGISEEIHAEVRRRLPTVGRIDIAVETEYASEHEERRVFRRRDRRPPA